MYKSPTFITLAAVLMVLASQVDFITAAASGNCNYCKHQDTIAGPLYSFGYCKTLDTCYEDVWNHQNAWCPEAWIDGYALDLEVACENTIGLCQPFVSSNQYDARNLTGVRTLQAGQ